ncbi:DNA polymerase III subunit alpha [Cytobacillus sp. Hz8]|uniref:DNA polymerase III subunit alpha n=1 Tax=Cytobacillus sp. Hz8 TaxID=3347168 RepID=UPI0035D9C827
MSFIHLHVYSAYSLLTSTAKIDELVADAKQKGYRALALTDRNVMYGTITFYKECLKNKIKPIIGLTADILSIYQENSSFPLVLLAKNQEGFHNLMKISSAVQTKSSNGIPVKWLKHYTAGLIAITPGNEGEIESFLSNGENELAKELALLFAGLFGKENFYLAVQDHGLHEEKLRVKKILEMAQEESLEVVATNHVHYLNQSDARSHECLLAIKNGDKLQDEARERLESDEYYLKTANEMAELFSSIPNALENTLHIAEKCNVMIEIGKKSLPKYPTKDGQASYDLLEDLCYQGFQVRYPHPTEEHKKRLKYELRVIKQMKFSDYFLIVWDFMKFSRENGIFTGPGRGSAAGSMVAYVLFITEIDPIRYHLLFERFLNPERITMPDIDIDFPDHRREEVIRYVSSKYGELHVAQIITFGTLAAKAAIRDVGRAYGLNTKELDQLSRLIPSKLGISLESAYRESSGLKDFVEASPSNRQLFETAMKLEGLPRHTSTHAAGVVISEDPLVNVIPIQRGSGGVHLTQYSMEHLEDLGLLKMDFLGLRNLSLLESILTQIKRKTGVEVDIKSIPLDDELTFQLMSKGTTTGVFQFESDGMRDVLRRLKPSRFEDIVAVNALYRPGPMENIPLFIERKLGQAPIHYPHPDLKPILENTYGVIVYQEQIMQIASKMAGFSLGESDLLRRAVSKKKREVLDKERNHFVQGALKNGYNEETAHTIYDLIVKFANYGFNRSHAVAYSMIAYQLAYLKAHYPLYFMASLLSAVIGNDAKIAEYTRELKEMNLAILGPSINKSGFSFLVEKGAIRYSLAAIKGIGVSTLKDIFQVRKTKKFQDLFDFCIRVPSKNLNRKILEAMVHSGSFDEFGVDRAVLLASLDVAIEHAELVKPLEVNQMGLFSEDEFFIKPKYVEVDPIGLQDKLQFEKAVLGQYLSSHPVSVYDSHYHLLGAKQITDLTLNGKQEKLIVLISEVKKIRTKKGDAMAFLKVSDQSGDMEAVLFPNPYSQLSSLIKQGQILIVSGKLEERLGNQQFIIQKGNLIENEIKNNEKQKRVLYLKVEKSIETIDHLKKLKNVIAQNRGNIEVILFYESSRKTIRLGKNDRVSASDTCITEMKNLLGEKNVILRM